jgi:hypothetical protein
VEVELQAERTTRRPNQYFDPVSVGGLIVGVATLAWNVYKDLRSEKSKPSDDAVARRVRVALREADAPVVRRQDLIIEVVVREVIQAADEDG